MPETSNREGYDVPNGKLDEAEIRRIVLAAVTAHMKPWGEILKSVHDWQTGFWSNGSGKPLGFFQMRMKADDERRKHHHDQVRNPRERAVKHRELLLEEAQGAEEQ